MNYAKVEGEKGLVKTPHGAVINTDRRGLDAARKLKQQRLQEMKKLESLESKVDELYSILDKLTSNKDK